MTRCTRALLVATAGFPLMPQRARRLRKSVAYFKISPRFPLYFDNKRLQAFVGHFTLFLRWLPMRLLRRYAHYSSEGATML